MQLFYPFVWIAFIVCVFLVWFFSHRANHKERLVMIEKGINMEELARKKPGLKFPWFKLGILVIGLSVGLLLISILAALKLLNKGGDALPLAILGACGGIAMLVGNNQKNSKSND